MRTLHGKVFTRSRPYEKDKSAVLIFFWDAEGPTPLIYAPPVLSPMHGRQQGSATCPAITLRISDNVRRGETATWCCEVCHGLYQSL